MKVAVTSLACENLALRNVARPNGWKYFSVYDRVPIAEYNPDVLVMLGWFCHGWADWQSHKATIGDVKRVVVHWVGSDILQMQNELKMGRKTFIEWLASPRFLHVAPSEDSFKELVYEDGTPMFNMHGPLDVPAEHVIDPQPMPAEFRPAIYMPPDRQDFYGIKVMADVLPKMGIKPIFYHWLPKVGELDYPAEHDEAYGLAREEYEERILKGASCLIRVPMHDANSISVGEFFMAGKPVVTNQNLPMWKFGCDAPLYRREVDGGYMFTDNAHTLFEKEVKRIKDLCENGKSPVPQKTQDFYRDMYDPAKYPQKLNEFAAKQAGWEGVRLEPTTC